MKNLLFIISAFIAFNANAGFRTFTSAGVQVLGEPDCKVYLVSIWQDYGNSDPTTWKKVAEKHIWSDGCDFGTDQPDVSIYDFPASDNYAFISSITEEGGCTDFEIQLISPSGVMLASGDMNSCDDSPVTGKRALDPDSKLVLRKTIEVFPTVINEEINVNGLAINQKSNIDIFDTNGKLVFTSNVMLKENLTLNLASLKPSVYFIHIRTNGKSLNKRIIKL